jgi:hypothetical protein
MDNGYSELYNKQVTDLTAWFTVRLNDTPRRSISKSDYLMGVDSLPEQLSVIVKEAFDTWIRDRKYELSYNQMCNAFFQAAATTGKVQVV